MGIVQAEVVDIGVEDTVQAEVEGIDLADIDQVAAVDIVLVEVMDIDLEGTGQVEVVGIDLAVVVNIDQFAEEAVEEVDTLVEVH